MKATWMPLGLSTDLGGGRSSAIVATPTAGTHHPKEVGGLCSYLSRSRTVAAAAIKLRALTGYEPMACALDKLND